MHCRPYHHWPLHWPLALLSTIKIPSLPNQGNSTMFTLDLEESCSDEFWLCAGKVLPWSWWWYNLIILAKELSIGVDLCVHLSILCVWYDMYDIFCTWIISPYVLSCYASTKHFLTCRFCCNGCMEYTLLPCGLPQCDSLCLWSDPLSHKPCKYAENSCFSTSPS